MIVVACICLAGEFAGFIMGSANFPLFETGITVPFIIAAVLEWVFALASIPGIPVGIVGIRKKEKRGMSIATIAVSSLSFLLGLVIALTLTLIIIENGIVY